jgi:lysozyme
VDELKKEVTEKMVEDALNAKIREFEGVVRRNVTYPLNQEQYDALVSFTYNRGPAKSYETFRKINDGELNAAADHMKKLITAKVGNKSVVAKGLIVRREKESAPFVVDVVKVKEEIKK